MSSVTMSKKLCKRNKNRSFLFISERIYLGTVCWDYEKQGNRVKMPGSFPLIYSFTYKVITEYIACDTAMLRAGGTAVSSAWVWSHIASCLGFFPVTHWVLLDLQNM